MLAFLPHGLWDRLCEVFLSVHILLNQTDFIFNPDVFTNFEFLWFPWSPRVDRYVLLYFQISIIMLQFIFSFTLSYFTYWIHLGCLLLHVVHVITRACPRIFKKCLAYRTGFGWSWQLETLGGAFFRSPRGWNSRQAFEQAANRTWPLFLHASLCVALKKDRPKRFSLTLGLRSCFWTPLWSFESWDLCETQEPRNSKRRCWISARDFSHEGFTSSREIPTSGSSLPADWSLG